MKNNPHNPSADQLIKFENELLKLKLEAEFGMQQQDTSGLSPEVENVWLKNIYDFEAQFKNAKRIKVFDALGRPKTKKLDQLSGQDVSKALAYLTTLMEEKGIALDCCCQYDDSIIYRFITEELFECEMDDISIEGMVHHFLYEEFHPNHDYDLRLAAEQFVRNLLEKKWDPQFNAYSLSDTVTLKEKTYDDTAISSLILAFQSDREFEVEELNILQVSFDMVKNEGIVKSHLAYTARFQQQNHLFQGDYEVTFLYKHGLWLIRSFQFPGI